MADMSDEVYDIIRSAVNLSRSDRPPRTADGLRTQLLHFYPGKEAEIDEAVKYWANNIASKGRPSLYD
jgi:hypothetical protein